ncbi:MAG TPA: YdiU family protein [Ilumatobacter sp.]|nr:YdiU family protein [Ilumatobacter sp.]
MSASSSSPDTRLLITFDNTYARELGGLYADAVPTAAIEPRLVAFNDEVATALGLDGAALRAHGAEYFSGNQLLPGAQPIAQAYAGHQFGSFNPGLGDGRALLLGEVVDTDGVRRDIGLKGSGRTPFSRGGDGRATIGPVLREYLLGEAMHALGVPTTRALAAVVTSDLVMRRRPEPGAVLTRVAASHLRVGTFQYFAARQQQDEVARLVEYALARHGVEPTVDREQPSALQLLHSAVARQARLVAQWMAVGFIHGVMNTDNCTISGETIDYGPCAFVEPYDPNAVYSSIDEGGRYAFGNQPGIAGWNMARLAEALLPQLGDDSDAAVALATAAIEQFRPNFEAAYLGELRRKLGLATVDSGDQALADEFLGLLEQHRVDLTLAWRSLSDVHDGDETGLRALFAEPTVVDEWLSRYVARCASDPLPDRGDAMRQVNPLFVARNEHVERALDAAVEGDFAPFERLLDALSHPYEDRPADAVLAVPSQPRFLQTFRTFCGT